MELNPSILGLVEFARSGDQGSAEELFRRFLPRVRRIVSLRMGMRERDFSDREDIVQETLLDAFKALAQFNPQSEGALCNWLATLVENNIRDQVRWRRRRKREGVLHRPQSSTELSTALFGTDECTPSAIAEAAELEGRLEDALLALNGRERRAIELRRMRGLSFDEMASLLNLGTASSARSLFSRAMSALSARL